MWLYLNPAISESTPVRHAHQRAMKTAPGRTAPGGHRRHRRSLPYWKCIDHFNGQAYWDKTTCVDVLYAGDPPAMGACCLPDNSCVFESLYDCDEAGGRWGECVLATPAACEYLLNGVSHDDVLVCDSEVCGTMGTCCRWSGEACSVITLEECIGHVFYYGISSCSQVGCVLSGADMRAACCFDDGTCFHAAHPTICENCGGVAYGEGEEVDCSFFSCPQPATEMISWGEIKCMYR